MLDFVDACTELAPYACCVVYMAPIPTVQQIRRDKAVGSLPLLPYSSMAASAFIWTVYGFLKNEPKLWSCCSVGVLLASYYLMNFIPNSPKAAPTLPGSVSQHLQFILFTVLGSLYILKWYPAPDELIGFAGVMLSIAMFASPLSALKHVIQSKSAKSIPLPFTLASILNCFLWSVTGIFKMADACVYIPNVLGLAFSLVQIFLKLIYGDGHKEHVDRSESMELPA